LRSPIQQVCPEEKDGYDGKEKSNAESFEESGINLCSHSFNQKKKPRKD
jgi:hypothetical protein